MEQTDEQMHWHKFLQKRISLTKLVNGKELYYKGIVVAVYSDKLILDDRKLGEIPISYEGLSVIGIG